MNPFIHFLTFNLQYIHCYPEGGTYVFYFFSVKNAATTALVDEPSAGHRNADAAPQLTAASHVPLWPACGQQEHEWCELRFEQRLRAASATFAATVVSSQRLRPRPTANVASLAGRP